MLRITFAAALAAACVPAASAELISEFRPNPPGGDPDTQTVELFGTAGMSFTDWALISVESDAGNSGPGGLVDRATIFSGMFDADGLFTIDIDDLENPSFSFFLLDSFSGVVGTTDIDADDDGVADDTSSFGNVLDAIGVADETNDLPFLYAEQFGGTNLATTFEPELTFRSGSMGDLFSVDGDGTIFDADGNQVDPSDFVGGDPTMPSFGAINPVFAPAQVPEPASFALIGLAAIGGAAARRRRKVA